MLNESFDDSSTDANIDGSTLIYEDVAARKVGCSTDFGQSRFGRTLEAYKGFGWSGALDRNLQPVIVRWQHNGREFFEGMWAVVDGHGIGSNG